MLLFLCTTHAHWIDSPEEILSCKPIRQIPILDILPSFQRSTSECHKEKSFRIANFTKRFCSLALFAIYVFSTRPTSTYALTFREEFVCLRGKDPSKTDWQDKALLQKRKARVKTAEYILGRKSSRAVHWANKNMQVLQRTIQNLLNQLKNGIRAWDSGCQPLKIRGLQ